MTEPLSCRLFLQQQRRCSSGDGSGNGEALAGWLGGGGGGAVGPFSLCSPWRPRPVTAYLLRYPTLPHSHSLPSSLPPFIQTLQRHSALCYVFPIFTCSRLTSPAVAVPSNLTMAMIIQFIIVFYMFSWVPFDFFFYCIHCLGFLIICFSMIVYLGSFHYLSFSSFP